MEMLQSGMHARIKKKRIKSKIKKEKKIKKIKKSKHYLESNSIPPTHLATKL